VLSQVLRFWPKDAARNKGDPWFTAVVTGGCVRARVCMCVYVCVQLCVCVCVRVCAWQGPLGVCVPAGVLV
jgi:hypothetical protein